MSDKTENKPQNMFDKAKSLFTKSRIKDFFPFFGLVVIIVLFDIFTNGQLLQAKSLNLILSQLYVPMIACIGVFMVMTIGGLDLSQGSILGISSIVISFLSYYSIILAIIGGIAMGAFVGAINGFFHVKFKIPSFIVTVCTMYLFRGLCAFFTTSSPASAVASITNLNMTWLKLFITIFVLIICSLVYRYSKLGLVLKSTGAGETAARFSGIKTDKVKFLVFLAAGAITGFAAFLNVIKVGSVTSSAGSQLEIQVLTALVLGGLPISGGSKSHFSSVIVGTFIYCILNNGLVMMGFDSAVQQLVKGVIFVIIVALTIDRKSNAVIK